MGEREKMEQEEEWEETEAAEELRERREGGDQLTIVIPSSPPPLDLAAPGKFELNCIIMIYQNNLE